MTAAMTAAMAVVTVTAIFLVCYKEIGNWI